MRNSQTEEPAFLIVILLLVMFPPMTSDIQLPAIPTMAKVLHTSQDLVKLVTGLYALGYAIGQLLYGPASDRFGQLPVLRVGIGLYIVFTLICALSPNVSATI